MQTAVIASDAGNGVEREIVDDAFLPDGTLIIGDVAQIDDLLHGLWSHIFPMFCHG